jgi:hypothetical protein
VRVVATRAAELAARVDPELIRSLGERPAPPPPDRADLMALMSRCLAHLEAAAR